jgi:hypothetical protein
MMDFWVGDQLFYYGGVDRTGEEIYYTVTIEDVAEDAVKVRHAPPYNHIVFWWNLHSTPEDIINRDLVGDIENGKVIVILGRNREPDWEI